MEKHKLYYEQPYLKEFEARVSDCSEKNGIFEITLENTCFYPEGGGQPSDTGIIGDANITFVKEQGEDIIHIADKPLEKGKTYTAKIDWPRRYDHMQHHSAEHVVSGIINKLYGADNVGFHIGEEYITMDYNVLLTKEDIEKIEYLSNEAVFKNITIKIDYYDNTPEIDYRSKKELSGIIRIVTIENCDVCACCGTQLSSTGEIGLIKIVSFQKYKSGSRLFMVCGFRALRDYQLKENNISEISAILSCKPYESAKYVAQINEEKERLKFDLMKAKFDLIDIKTAARSPSEKAVVFEENLSSEEMRRFLNNLAEKCKSTAIFSGNDDEGYKYVFTSEREDFPTVVKAMNSALNGKGGGKDVAQGFLNATKLEIQAFMENI